MGASLRCVDQRQMLLERECLDEDASDYILELHQQLLRVKSRTPGQEGNDATSLDGTDNTAKDAAEDDTHGSKTIRLLEDSDETETGVQSHDSEVKRDVGSLRNEDACERRAEVEEDGSSAGEEDSQKETESEHEAGYHALSSASSDDQ